MALVLFALFSAGTAASLTLWLGGNGGTPAKYLALDIYLLANKTISYNSVIATPF